MKPGKELLFLALGGSGEIGMNVNLYGCDGKWIMVDLGMTFADPAYPGVELVLPDLSFIEERRDDLLGVVLTHGHEDHIGAIPYLADDLGVPLWATPFTAGLIAEKLQEEGLERQIKVNIIDIGGTMQIGPFGFRFVPLAHSIPEGNALLIDTPYGKVFHTGDWKLDEFPQLGDPADAAALTRVGDEGILALVCDSTNVFQEEASGSEEQVREGLDRVIGEAEGRVLVTTFASNAARLSTLGKVAQDTGRKVCVAGRSLDRILRVARERRLSHRLPGDDRFRDRHVAAQARRDDHRHRRPGREPRRARPDRLRPAPDQAQRGRSRRLLLQADTRQRDRHRPDPERAGRARDQDDHRPAGQRPRLRPSRPARARRHVRLDPARDHRPGPWRDAPHGRA